MNYIVRQYTEEAGESYAMYYGADKSTQAKIESVKQLLSKEPLFITIKNLADVTRCPEDEVIREGDLNVVRNIQQFKESNVSFHMSTHFVYSYKCLRRRLAGEEKRLSHRVPLKDLGLSQDDIFPPTSSGKGMLHPVG